MWFKRKKQELRDSGDRLSDKAATGIGNLIRGAHTRFGDSLNQKTANLNERGKVILLVLILIFLGGGSIYIIVDGLSSPAKSSVIAPQSISVPRHFDKTGDSRVLKQSITSDEMAKIKDFRHLLDSLKNSQFGYPMYDSLMNARPGLMDSLIQLERLYNGDSIP